VSNKNQETIGRKYIENTIKIAAHPIRALILKTLKEKSMTANELEEITKESRFNIYYHLSELEKTGLVCAIPVDKKTKRYELNTPRKPETAVLIFTEEEISSRSKEFSALLNAAEKMEKAEIPHRDRIVRAEISFYYSWEKD
jgi:DNA-binding transcriptional ArsR family regulator